MSYDLETTLIPEYAVSDAGVLLIVGFLGPDQKRPS
jgi:hypothetical protein